MRGKQNIKFLKMYCSIDSLLTVVVFLHFWPNKYFGLKLPIQALEKKMAPA
jgi:hypothetical protein